MRKAIILPALLLVACSNYSANLPSLKPYRMEIQQGNVVTPKMMLQLRPGMTKSQVRFVMGTPLIADSFHANRWDYFYQLRKDGKIVEQRRVILDFENEQLKTVRGDVIPAGNGDSQADTSVTKAPYTLKSTSDAPAKEKGMLDKLKFWKDDEPKPASEATTTTAPANRPAEPMPAKATEPAAPASKPVAKTAPAPTPKQEAAPQKEEKGLLDKLKFWKSDESTGAAQPVPAQKAAPVQKSAPAPEPRKIEVQAAPKPEPEPEPVTQPAPKAELKPMPKTESKPVPKPAQELPPEDDPSYFERMLEKIGF